MTSRFKGLAERAIGYGMQQRHIRPGAPSPPLPFQARPDPGKHPSTSAPLARKQKDTMNSFTEPGELFREIGEIHDLVGEIVQSDLTQIRHWPTYYLLYVDVDRLGWDIDFAGRSLAGSLSLTESPDQEETNEAVAHGFGRLQVRVRAIVSWLERWASHSMLIRIGDDGLKHRLHSHFRLKSQWRDMFLQDYCAGKLSNDGKVLERSVLFLDPQPTYRMFDVHEKGLLQRQRFDIAADRAALADASRQLQRRIGTVQAAMMRRLSEQCKIADLLHPSSL